MVCLGVAFGLVWRKSGEWSGNGLVGGLRVVLGVLEAGLWVVSGGLGLVLMVIGVVIIHVREASERSIPEELEFQRARRN